MERTSGFDNMSKYNGQMLPVRKVMEKMGYMSVDNDYGEEMYLDDI